MEETEQLNLIDGEFTNEETFDILINIFLTKIQFHESKNFSSIVRFGYPDKVATKRIPELNLQIEKLRKILSKPELKDSRFAISSNIFISII